MFGKDSSGKLVPREAGAQRVVKRVQVDPERFIPAAMPSRLAESVILPGLKGGSLWPRP